MHSPLESALHACLSSASGETVRAHLQSAIESPSFDPDPYQTAFKEGQRALALKLLSAFWRVENGKDETDE